MITTPNIIDSCELYADGAKPSVLPESVIALSHAPVRYYLNNHCGQPNRGAYSLT